jgi:hypothetical protein|tara:strand:- start:160 stop:369 length:210 start_codon:yes stop_codon:yes gene_type:complete
MQEIYTGSILSYRILVEDGNKVLKMGTIDAENKMSDETHELYAKLLATRYNVNYNKIWIIPNRIFERGM